MLQIKKLNLDTSKKSPTYANETKISFVKSTELPTKSPHRHEPNWAISHKEKDVNEGSEGKNTLNSLVSRNRFG